jgi:putative heme iron utilization protein
MLRGMVANAHGRVPEVALTFSESDVPAPSHAERARTLVAQQSTGSLATLALDPIGYPYASFITFSLLGHAPIFLISRLAEHTRNLSADPRASLLVHETGKADPLANGRVTLVGQAGKLPRTDRAAREAYLTTHPGAAYYADYEDFDFWSLQVKAVRYIGGYGRMSWIDADAFAGAVADPLASAAPRILEHMNQDHAAALKSYALAFTQAFDAEQATMTAIDRHGFDMTVRTRRGVGPARVSFDVPLTGAEDARPALVALLRAAEAKLAKAQ